MLLPDFISQIFQRRKCFWPIQRLKQLSSAQQNATGHQPKAKASVEYFHILEIFYYNFTMAYSLERNVPLFIQLFTSQGPRLWFTPFLPLYMAMTHSYNSPCLKSKVKATR